MLDRRQVLFGLGGAAGFASPSILPGFAAAADQSPLPSGLPEGVYDTALLDALPGKKPLIKLSYRPPNYETPVGFFDRTFTANDAFFVRYHLAGVPDTVDAASWKIRIGGDAAASPLELGLADLKSGFEQIELAAVCQCSGNRRGFSQPHVPGVQWGLGAMGNALWRGARLKDVLAKAGLRTEAVEVVVRGTDVPALEKTPPFVKSIPVWKALDDNTLIAYEMNGQPLPLLNGAPVRLVVPGWTATYWMKHLAMIDVVAKPFDGYWVKSAYRIPAGKFPLTQHFLTQMTEANEPITEMLVNSVIAAPLSGERARVGQPIEIRGIAWDAGYGISRVEVSSDGGDSWRAARLGKDEGRFGFRPWSFRIATTKPGAVTILAKASNSIGQTQAETLIFNPAGYHNNLVRPVTVTVA